MGRNSRRNNNKKPNKVGKNSKKPTTTESQNQQNQESDKSLVTLFTDATQSLQKKIQERAQNVQYYKQDRPDNYVPDPVQESYPYSIHKKIKNFLSVLAQKKSSNSKTVLEYLNNRVSGDDLRFQIFKNEDLKQIPGVPNDSFEILIGALNSVGDSFHFWDCCRCHQRHPGARSLIAHVEGSHLPKIDDVSGSFIPEIADEDWAEEFLTTNPGNWEPLSRKAMLLGAYIGDESQTLEKSEAASEEPIEEQKSDDGSWVSEIDHPLIEDEKEGDSGEPVMQDAVGVSSDMPDYEDHLKDDYRESASGTLEEKVKDFRRGLLNSAGDNNCFLNVIIQTLWHVRQFRTEFMSTENIGNNSVVTKLRNVFVDLANSSEEPVNPSRLREAMSKLNAQRFLEGEMGDPNEALEAILNCLHQSLTSSSSSKIDSGDQDRNSKCTCIAHRLFARDQSFCFEHICNDWVHYLEMAALRKMKKKYADRSIGELQKEADEGEQVCEGCNKQIDRCEQFSTASQVVTCSLAPQKIVAEEEKKPDELKAQISETLASMPTEVYFASCGYHLVSIVCFCSEHYICFIRNSCGIWVKYDDLTSNEIGGWDGVVTFCKESDFLPTTVFFEADSSMMKALKAGESPRQVNFEADVIQDVDLGTVQSVIRLPGGDEERMLRNRNSRRNQIVWPEMEEVEVELEIIWPEMEEEEEEEQEPSPCRKCVAIFIGCLLLFAPFASIFNER